MDVAIEHADQTVDFPIMDVSSHLHKLCPWQKSKIDMQLQEDDTYLHNSEELMFYLR